MPDRVKIEFRGVCLYVPRPSEGLMRVLLPWTHAAPPHAGAKKHYAFLTIYDENNKQFGDPVSLTGEVLEITSVARPKNYDLKGLINLRDFVTGTTTSVKPSPVVGTDVATLVTVRGGSSWSTEEESKTEWEWANPSTKLGKKHLAVIWEGGSNENITLRLTAGEVLKVEAGQTVVIGHYDRRSDAKKRDIEERVEDVPVNGKYHDHDFAWLYSLLTDPTVKGVPLTHEPTVPDPPPDEVPVRIMSPLTTTCFGATWEPEE